MRPSLAQQREIEILQAVEKCIRDVGIGGLTTQRIAEESGYSRSHIRHYLGNKDDQLQALVRHYMERYASSLEQLVRDEVPSAQREVILKELFGETWQDLGQEDDLVLDQLNAYASSTPGGPSLTPMYRRICAVVQGTLEEAGLNPEAAAPQSQLVVAFAYGVSSMLRLGLMDQTAALAHARSLLLLDSDRELL